MAITNGYCTLAEVKAQLGIAVTDTDDDTALERVVAAVSRQIDNYCGRRFWKDSADTTRYYTPKHRDFLAIDELVSVTTLKADQDGDRTYETTWATTDYDLMPYNASTDDWPYTWIETAPNGSYSFVGMPKEIQIIGVFGWPAVPAPVKDACLLQAERIFKRKDAPFGISGPNEFGAIVTLNRFDPDVAAMLNAYRRSI